MTLSLNSPLRHAAAAPERRVPPTLRLRPAPVAWSTVVVLAVVLAYADGFVLTSIQGAVGAVERAQGPFNFWLRTSTAMVPVFAIAVLLALAVARRLLGPSLRGARKVVVAAMLIAVAGGLVGSTEMVVSAGYDYRLQSQLASSMDSLHVHDPVVATASGSSACTGVCAAQQDQFDVDQRAARIGSGMVLGLNVLLVGWILAFRGGRLETVRPTRRHPAGTGAEPRTA